MRVFRISRKSLWAHREDFEMWRRPDVAQTRGDRADPLDVEPDRGALLVEAAMAIRVPIGLGDFVKLVVDSFVVAVLQDEELPELLRPAVSDEVSSLPSVGSKSVKAVSRTSSCSSKLK